MFSRVWGLVLGSSFHHFNIDLYFYSFYQNEGAEWRILVPGCVDFLGRMWTARLSACLSVCLSAWVGRGPPTHPLLGKGGKASQATHPATHSATHPSGDPPQRPTLVLIAMWRVLGKQGFKVVKNVLWTTIGRRSIPRCTYDVLAKHSTSGDDRFGITQD